jgi:hypothetical protein
MASNEPTGDKRRIGAVRKRSQRKRKLMGKTAWTKRSRQSGRFMDVKNTKPAIRAMERATISTCLRTAKLSVASITPEAAEGDLS